MDMAEAMLVVCTASPIAIEVMALYGDTPLTMPKRDKTIYSTYREFIIPICFLTRFGAIMAFFRKEDHDVEGKMTL